MFRKIHADSVRNVVSVVVVKNVYISRRPRNPAAKFTHIRDLREEPYHLLEVSCAPMRDRLRRYSIRCWQSFRTCSWVYPIFDPVSVHGVLGLGEIGIGTSCRFGNFASTEWSIDAICPHRRQEHFRRCMAPLERSREYA